MSDRQQPHLPSIVDGQLVRTSPSQISAFQACPRAWGYDKIWKFPRKQFKSADLGKLLHKEPEHYFKTGEDVFGRILRPAVQYMPKKGPGVTAEGSLAVPPLVVLDVTMVGFYDWIDASNPLSVQIGDLKTRSDIWKYGLSSEELEKDIQGITYAKWATLRFPEAREITFRHVYAQTRGAPQARMSETVAPLTVWAERWDLTVKPLVAAMKELVTAKAPEELPHAPDEKVCWKYGGCSFANVCPHSPTRRLTMGLFDDAPAPAAPKSKAETDGPGWAFVECEVCKMAMTALGKRPAGSKIAASLCPNFKSHDAVEDPLAASLKVSGATGVVPSDAPKSDPALAAEPLPAEDSVEEPKKRGRKPKTREGGDESKAPPIKDFMEVPALPPMLLVPTNIAGFTLLIDAAPVGRAYMSAEDYVRPLANALAKKVGALDIRLSEHELMKFGKWEACLAEKVRENPPAPGTELVVFSQSVYARAVIDGLSALAAGIYRRAG